MAFISYPKMAAKYKGRIVTDMVHMVDWYPTILTLAGYKHKVLTPDS